MQHLTSFSPLRGLLLCGALILASCGGGDAKAPPIRHLDASVPGTDAGGDGDHTLPGDGDHTIPGDGDHTTPGDGDHTTPGDGDHGTDAGKPSDGKTIRFIALGDAGSGDANQKAVAAAIKTVCAKKGCDFALYLGDNIYDTGVKDENDALFQSNFEMPYADLDFPFYVALGNHDFGMSGSNISSFLTPEANPKAEVAYSSKSQKWKMPSPYYNFRVGDLEVFVLDTNSMILEETTTSIPTTKPGTPISPLSEQKTWLDGALAKSTAPWKIVMGHHTYLSNGEHGNAGDYQASALTAKETPGVGFKGFIDDAVCGKAQLYLCGHDHDREWLESTCGTSFIVSGGGGKALRTMPGRGTKSRWSDDKKFGFLWVEISGDTLTGIFYDQDGAESYEDSIARQ
jgi:tartrate-resistant acid phosphatase type 5